MKTSRTILKWIGWMLVTVLVLLLVKCLVVDPTRKRWELSHEVSEELTHARSVTFIEFTSTYFDERTEQFIHKETVLDERGASPKQIKDLCAAIQPSLVLSDGSMRIAGCFNPHHRVRATRQDGSVFVMEICFACHNFQFREGFDQPIPLTWLPRLRQFFTDLGMPPRDDAEYILLAEAKPR